MANDEKSFLDEKFIYKFAGFFFFFCGRRFLVACGEELLMDFFESSQEFFN